MTTKKAQALFVVIAFIAFITFMLMGCNTSGGGSHTVDKNATQTATDGSSVCYDQDTDTWSRENCK